MGQRPGAPKKSHVPEDVSFRTKPQIALELIDRARANGVEVKAWTADEFYGRDGAVRDGLEERRQVFVAESPVHFHGWLNKPRLAHTGPKPRRPTECPRVPRRRPSALLRNLVRYSPVFQQQAW